MEQISDFRGLAKAHPWFALMMLFAMLSMIGMPPFVGFYAKLAILQHIVAEGLVWLAIYAIVFIVISAYYYLNVIKAMYFDTADNAVSTRASVDLRVILSINALLILLIGLAPDYWFELTRSLLP